MTDYNKGEIWGWNGGDCPVHPESVVEIWLRDDVGGFKDRARTLAWTHDKDDGDIIAFRVVEQHVEPKSIWVNEYANGVGQSYSTQAQAISNSSAKYVRIAVEFREVKK